MPIAVVLNRIFDDTSNKFFQKPVQKSSPSTLWTLCSFCTDILTYTCPIDRAHRSTHESAMSQLMCWLIHIQHIGQYMVFSWSVCWSTLGRYCYHVLIFSFAYNATTEANGVFEQITCVDTSSLRILLGRIGRHLPRVKVSSKLLPWQQKWQKLSTQQI